MATSKREYDMITLDEDLLTLRQAAQLIPSRSGRPIDVSSIWRWTLRGIKGKRLESVSLGGQKYTSRQALARFVSAINPSMEATAPAARTHAQRASGSVRAGEQLTRAGI